MFKWHKNFETGIDMVDHQHQHLFNLINKLNEEILLQLQYDNYDNILEVLTQLKDYTIDHFQQEEALMKETLEKLQNQPSFTEFWSYLRNHKKQHSAFVNKIEMIFNSEIDENQEEISLELVEFLVNWLQDHILTIDQQLTNYI